MIAFDKSAALATGPATLPVALPSLVSAVITPVSTSTFTRLSAPSVSMLTVVPLPFTKFTASYALTKSTALPLPFRFQPLFKMSPTVAALFAFTLPSAVPIVGADCDLLADLSVGLAASAVLRVSGRFDLTFDKVVGDVVPFAPLTETITSPAGTSPPVPSAFG